MNILIIFVFVAIVVAAALLAYGYTEIVARYGGRETRRSKRTVKRRDVVKNLEDWPPSKAEQYVRGEFESLTSCKFPTVYPSWLCGMELDGYCSDMALAFEYQGPQHTRFDKKYDRVYKTYYDRVLADQRKIQLCRDNSVDLVIVDYIVPKHLVKLYIECRLHDLYTNNHKPSLQQWSTRPQNYMIQVEHEPYRNHIWEREIEDARSKKHKKSTS